MCTASWLDHPGGFQLFFNRDERRSRARSLPPRLVEAPGGARYLAPIDGESGGTWIAVNELGLAVCLLNRYPDRPLPSPRSRGHLVAHLAGAGYRGDSSVAGRLDDLDLADYRPFTLLVLRADRPAIAWEWDGVALVPDESLGKAGPLTSSSGDAAALDNRHAVWNEMRASGLAGTALHACFHRSHQPSASPVSVCMHRPEAETESHCRVLVTPDAVAMEWSPGPPCAGTPAHVLRLERANR